jgi:transposase
LFCCFALACCSWAQAAGFATDLWTRPRVAEHIERTIGMGYHVDHTGRLLHAMNRSQQKPARKAVEREAFGAAPQGASRWNLDAIHSAEGK